MLFSPVLTFFLVPATYVVVERTRTRFTRGAAQPTSPAPEGS
jgi:hypothetical protein